MLNLADRAATFSVVTGTLRCRFAQEVADTVASVAGARRAAPEVARQVQAELLHRLMHWLCRNGTHFVGTKKLSNWIFQHATRLVCRELRRRTRPCGLAPLDDAGTRRALAGWHRIPRPIRLGDIVRVWMQLTYLEQRVLRLLDLKYDPQDVALVLEITPNAVAFYRNQAHRKIHRAFMGLH